MRLEANWRYKSIESLEKENAGNFPADESSIVQRIWKLKKRPINEFAVDDIRFMIIQGIGLKYLLAEALVLLHENLLTEGNYYEGDLLNSILQIEKQQWRLLDEYWFEVENLIRHRVDELKAMEPKMKVDYFYTCKPGK